MKVLFALALATLVATPAFANPRMEFDVEAAVIEIGAPRLFSYEHHYAAEFKEVGLEKGIKDGILQIHADLPLRRPVTNEPISYNFGFDVLYFPYPNGRPPYIVTVDFGPGQPLNKDTRWSTVSQWDLHSFGEYTINGKEVEFKNPDGSVSIATPILKIKNVRYFE